MRNIPISKVLSYMDDVLVVGESKEQHLSNLREVLQAHRQAGVFLKPSKCLLFRTSCSYLGFTISSEGIKIKLEYLAKVKNWPSPRSLAEVEHLLGFSSFYRSLIPKYAIMTRHMSGYRNKKRIRKPVEWDDE